VWERYLVTVASRLSSRIRIISRGRERNRFGLVVHRRVMIHKPCKYEVRNQGHLTADGRIEKISCDLRFDSGQRWGIASRSKHRRRKKMQKCRKLREFASFSVVISQHFRISGFLD
jgi:hypothetical protein